MTMTELLELWRGHMTGVEVKGTVTDPESGDSREYHYRCTAVSWSGLPEDARIAFVWDDQLTDSYARLERDEAALEGISAEDFAGAFEQGIKDALAGELAASQYEGGEGEL